MAETFSSLNRGQRPAAMEGSGGTLASHRTRTAPLSGECIATNPFRTSSLARVQGTPPAFRDLKPKRADLAASRKIEAQGVVLKCVMRFSHSGSNLDHEPSVFGRRQEAQCGHVQAIKVVARKDCAANDGGDQALHANSCFSGEAATRVALFDLTTAPPTDRHTPPFAPKALRWHKSRAQLPRAPTLTTRQDFGWPVPLSMVSVRLRSVATRGPMSAALTR